MILKLGFILKFVHIQIFELILNILEHPKPVGRLRFGNNSNECHFAARSDNKSNTVAREHGKGELKRKGGAIRNAQGRQVGESTMSGATRLMNGMRLI